jgi:hypothetical protein|tara:strand:+ start:293 stop:502 length:210 start_codon:yes stop_codon:yes gene_type:complete
MSHWSKDAIIERAEQDALEMSTLNLGELLVRKDNNITWKNISEHVKDEDDLIDQAIEILVEDYMNQSGE